MEDKMKKGKTYNVTHCRKGSFTIKVKSQTEDWVTGTLIDGKPEVLVADNQVFEGEEITLRKTFLTKIKEIK